MATGGERQAPLTSIQTEHNDMIFDIQLDYYGKRMATCSADRTFRIYDLSPSLTPESSEHKSDEQEEVPTHLLQHVVQLPDDSGAPIQRACWAHPKFGSLLALAAQDGQVYVYREELHPNGSGATDWFLKYIHQVHQQSVLSIAWAPYEYGLCLASASADGSVSMLSRLPEGWVVTSSFQNSDDGAACTSVAWAPSNSLGAQGESGPIHRVVTASTNHTVRLWQLQDDNQWTPLDTLHGHQDWVREVAWAPNVGVPANVIASASDDCSVRIWTQVEVDGGWQSQLLHTFRSPVYRLNWSLTGSVLSVSCGDDEVSVWKQKESGWVQLSSVTERGVQWKQ